MSKARDFADIAGAVSGGKIASSDIADLPTSIITSGTFADARIAASNVSQHAVSFDDDKIVNDISTLGLRVHTQENLNASNTNSASFDVFQDSSGITNLTNVLRDSNEYISSVAISNATPQADNTTILLVQARGSSNGSTSFTDTATNTPGQTTILSSAPVVSNAQALTNSDVSFFFDGNDIMYNDTNSPSSSAFQGLGGETNIAVEFWMYKINSPANTYTSGVSVLDIGQEIQIEFDSNEKLTVYYRNVTVREQSAMSTNAWHHVAWQKQGGTARLYIDGVQVDSGAPGGGITSGNLTDNTFRWGAHRSTGSRYFDGYLDILRVHAQNVFPDGTSFTASTRGYVGTTNATGSFEGATITAGASTSKMGAVITYQDNAGTNTLNTDIVLKLSADNGSNYSTATLTALPDFATGIKMAKVNDLSVTAGTQLKYKIEFANQSSGSKEARIRGVSLQY